MVTVSPQLAGVVGITLGVVIAGGTLFGGQLRRISSDSKAAGSKATGMAAEAIGNVRTVRAFAAEGHECAEFEGQTALARSLSVKTGAGIGVFTGTLALLGLSHRSVAPAFPMHATSEQPV